MGDIRETIRDELVDRLRTRHGCPLIEVRRSRRRGQPAEGRGSQKEAARETVGVAGELLRRQDLEAAAGTAHHE